MLTDPLPELPACWCAPLLVLEVASALVLEMMVQVLVNEAADWLPEVMQ